MLSVIPISSEYISLKNSGGEIPKLHDFALSNGFRYTSQEILLGESKVVCENIKNRFLIVDEGNLDVNQPQSHGSYSQVYFVSFCAKSFAYKKYTTPLDCGLAISTLREISVLTLISHSHIVDMVGIVVNDGVINGVLLERGICDVRKYLSSNSFSKKELVSIVPGLISALKYVHSLGVCHCDIKPDNIIVFSNRSGDITLKITDWGLGKTGSDDCGSSGSVVCALGYRPPEVLWGGVGVDYTAVDIWSFGCVVWYLWKKQRLFHGDDEKGLLEDILTTNIAKKAKDIPKFLRKIVIGSVNINPSRRFLV